MGTLKVRGRAPAGFRVYGSGIEPLSLTAEVLAPRMELGKGPGTFLRIC